MRGVYQRHSWGWGVPALAVVALLLAGGLASPQGGAGKPPRRLITQAVDASRTVILPGNTRPEANATNDRGAVSSGLRMEHMQLQLRLPAEKQQELDQLTRDQQDPRSPNYHKWLTPQQYNERFSLAPEDVAAITAWLQSEGFSVNAVNPQSIDFSGTAGQVRNAFHTEIHNLDVNGEMHIANMADPQIPAALAPAVTGIVSLNDFKPHPLYRPRASYSLGGGQFIVAPADLATIYNLNPLFAEGYSGQGQAIVVLEDSDIFPSVSPSTDWDTFRTTFGLTANFPQGSFSEVHPAEASGTNNCTDPGITSDDAEAILDAEWASAAAPNASIEVASCANSTTLGVLIALENLLDSGTPPAIISISYGESEPRLGAALNASIDSLYEQGATEGVSIFVAAGDDGAAGSDRLASSAVHGITVSGLASTPYNVAVGGTDFGDNFAGTGSTYWNPPNMNTAAFGSALSYVPEIPWNDSCASGLIATYLGFATSYGSSGLCNSSAHTRLLTTTAGSGGPSACATGNVAPGSSGVVSGTCAGYAKPAWQSVFGNPSDGVRDIPDVSLFAANGYWGHAYVFCWSDSANGGAACTGAPSGWMLGGGTSFGAPIMAGIQALVNQKAGEPQGNPDATYYALAAGEYGTGGSSACNSTLGNLAAGACSFYDITQGDIDVNCTPQGGTGGTPHNCYLPSGVDGTLSISNSAYQPGYPATSGWDFATGIGTVNAYNLANTWPGNSLTSSSGMAQSTVIGASFEALLIALVKDGSGNPLSGAVVTFAAPASGASGTFTGGVNTATTDASGQATSAAFTANGTTGNYAVIATASGQTGTSSFALTNVDFNVTQQTPAGTVQITSGVPATVMLEMATTPSNAAIPADVSFSCSVPAGLTGASCSVTPSTIAAGSASGSGVTLTVATTAPVPASSNAGPRGRAADFRLLWRPLALLWVYAATLGALVALLAAGVNFGAGCDDNWRGRRLPSYMALLMLAVAAPGLVSCAGQTTNEQPASTPSSTASSSASGPSSVVSTPVGPSSVTVTAVAAGVTRTTTVPVNVN